MTGEPLEELLARSLDGELTPTQQERLSRALEKSSELRELEQELHVLRKWSARDRVPGPPALEKKLQALVEQRFGKRPATIPRRLFYSGMAWAAVLIVGFGLGHWASRLELGGRGDSAGWLGASDERALAFIRASINQTRQEYHGAIQQVEMLALQRLEDLPSRVSQDLLDHLAMLDRAIETCETLVEDYPAAYHAHFSLARAYQAKVDLLGKILRA